MTKETCDLNAEIFRLTQGLEGEIKKQAPKAEMPLAVVLSSRRIGPTDAGLQFGTVRFQCTL